jgi:hypothetical protein
MLSQLVRPMVQTQIRLLANSRATRPTLVSTIAQWLGFLGVQAHVTDLNVESNQIHITLTVNKPDACDDQDWQQILQNLGAPISPEQCAQRPQEFMDTTYQDRRVQRLLAYLIQVANPGVPILWEQLQPQLAAMGFDDATLQGVRAALKVPQCLDDLLDGLEPDTAAIALPKAVSLAMMDRQVNPSEDQALTALLQAMKRSG